MHDLARRMTRAAEELERVLGLLAKPADLLPEERQNLLSLFQALLDKLRTEAWSLEQQAKAGVRDPKNNPLYDRVVQLVDRRLASQEGGAPPERPAKDKLAS